MNLALRGTQSCPAEEAQTWGGGSEGGQGWACGSAGSASSEEWEWLRESGLRSGVDGPAMEEGARSGADAGTEVFVCLCSSQSVPCILPEGPWRVMRAETPHSRGHYGGQGASLGPDAGALGPQPPWAGLGGVCVWASYAE